MRKKLYISKHFAKSKTLFFCQYLSFSVWFPLSLKHWSPLTYNHEKNTAMNDSEVKVMILWKIKKCWDVNSFLLSGGLEDGSWERPPPPPPRISNIKLKGWSHRRKNKTCCIFSVFSAQYHYHPIGSSMHYYGVFSARCERTKSSRTSFSTEEKYALVFEH